MYNYVYKSALENLEKFWNRENVDRCVLAVTAPLTEKQYRKPKSLEEKWLDAEFIYQKFKFNVENTYFCADAAPMFFTNLGPGVLSACVGGDFVLAENTIWFDKNPIVTDWNNLPDIRFYEESKMWKHIIRLQNRFLHDKNTNVSVTDLGGTLDIIASLRGTEELLFDLYDNPKHVKALVKKVNKIWFDAFNRQIELVGSTGLPYNNWMNIPSSKPWFPLQCDFSAMISPAQFEEFVLPGLIEQTNYMERSIYHLDGCGAIPHLDMILDIPKLTGIQWTAGAGQPPLWAECWLDMYKKIQSKKKNLVLLDGLSEHDKTGAEKLIKTLDPTGLYISAGCCNKAAAERLTECVFSWYKGRRK
ncbi:MAG: hypothetical protein M0R40_04080 [Firmicutes bacterium]|nr:hypothetical protein [Bacillota bacterium]